MVAMAKKPKTPDTKDEGGSKKVTISLDLCILATLDRYREEQKAKNRYKPTQRDVLELALISFFKAEGTKMVTADELENK